MSLYVAHAEHRALKVAKPALSISAELRKPGTGLLRHTLFRCEGNHHPVWIDLALTFAAVGPACAQTPSAEQKPPSAGQKPCSEPGDSSKTLSDKLAQGRGVICPPNVDPGIKVPAPESGKMPVIPPPGSPGGDPNVKPK